MPDRASLSLRFVWLSRCRFLSRFSTVQTPPHVDWCPT
jgi:hypothetical protein